MAYPQGAVVIATDPFGENPGGRPYIVLSNSNHPFAGEECVAAVVTTTDRANAIALDEGDFVRGTLPRESFVSPWAVVTLKHHAISKQVATVSDVIVEGTVEDLAWYLEVE